MNQLLRYLLIASSLAGQVVGVIGSPLLISAAQPSARGNRTLGCCCQANAGACCQDGCSCCAGKSDTPLEVSDDSDNPKSIAWMNPVSGNRCQGTHLINHLGTDLFIQNITLAIQNPTESQPISSFPKLLCIIRMDQDSPPPKHFNS